MFQVGALGLGLLSSILVARALGPENKGVLDAYRLLGNMIIEIAPLGFSYGLFYYQANKGASLNRVHGSALVVSIVLGGMVAALGWLFLGVWQRIFPNLSDWMILLAFSIAPIALYRFVWPNIMMGLDRARDNYKVSFALACVTLPIILWLWFTHRLDVTTAIGAHVAVMLLAFVFSVLLLLRIERHVRPEPALIKKSFHYGLTIYVAVLANFIHFKADQLMINLWLGSRSLGLYALSVQWAETLFLLDSAIMAASLHRIASTDQTVSVQLSRRLFRIQLMISGAAGIALALLASPMISLLYGALFHAAAMPLVLLIPGIVFWSTSKFLSVYLTYNRGAATQVTKAAVAGSIINIFFNYYVLEFTSLGINGVAAASTLSYGLVAGMVWSSYKKCK